MNPRRSTKSPRPRQCGDDLDKITAGRRDTTMSETNIEMYVIRGFPPPSTLPVDINMCYGDRTHAYERTVDTFPGTPDGREAAQKALGLLTLQLTLSRWPERLRNIADSNKRLSAEENDHIWQHAERIETTLRENEWVFDIQKVMLVRKRLSVTQGSVEVSYGGKLINCYGDDIKMIFKDKEALEKSLFPYQGRLIEREDDLDGCQVISNYAGLPNKVWHDAARRHLELSDPAVLYQLYRDTSAIVEKRVRPYLTGKLDDMDLHARTIIQGYEHVPGLTTTQHNVETLIAQLECKYPYAYPDKALSLLHAAAEENAFHSELTASGCEIVRGKIGLDAFEKAHARQDGWLEFPTGQEPYTAMRVNLAKLTVASYSEGDYHIVQTSDAGKFRQEILTATKFYAGYFDAIENFTGEIGEELLELVPEIKEISSEVFAEKTSAAPGLEG